jgi:hypothetical protein
LGTQKKKQKNVKQKFQTPGYGSVGKGLLFGTFTERINGSDIVQIERF